MSSDADDLERVIQHLVAKVIDRAQAGEKTIQLNVSPERHRQYSGQLQIQLGNALEAAGIHCSVRQWTGVGHCGVLEVVID